MLGVSEPRVLNFYALLCLIQLTLFVSRNLNLIHLSLFRFPVFLLCNLIEPTPDLAIYLRMPRTLATASSFSSGWANPYLNFLPPFFLHLTPTLINSSSLLSFLNVYARPICSSLTDGRTNSFSPSILPFSRNLFILGDHNCHYLFWDSKSTFDPCEEEVFDWVISYDLLPPPMILTYLLFSIVLLAVSPLLISLLLLPLSPYLAPCRCFRTWVLIVHQLY